MQPFGRNRYGPKIGGLCPFGGGELGHHLTQCDQAEGRGLPASGCMPSFILIRPTVWPQCTNITDRQDRQDRQRTDSIGRTVLQTVAEKRLAMLSDRCLSCPVSDVGVLWPNGWMDQDAIWYGGMASAQATLC